ncbi:hypothetical protein BASA82_000480 [Batrachochytrium salamandrivorans]|nr:hypothetical protein BASA82_000480 [Batrachochytrium salamandrivorans]
MIVYDTYAYAGLKVFLHATGSSLFSLRSILPALASGLLAALVANYGPVQGWLGENVHKVGLTTLGVQFLISLMLVNRIQLANIQYRAAHKLSADFHYALLRLGTLMTGCLDTCANQAVCPLELQQFRTKYLRWIRAMHILALEEFQGFESPEHRTGVLLFTEEIMLFRERRKAARVLRWLTRAYHKHRALIAPGTAIDGKMMGLLDDILLLYGATMMASNHIYPYPLAQLSFMCVVEFGIWLPLLLGVMMPQSYFLAPLLTFMAVWIAFSLNFAAQLLDWPFDGKANDLPLVHFGIRFMREMAKIEFGGDAPLLSHAVGKMLGDADFAEADYVVPIQRATVPGSNSGTIYCPPLRATNPLAAPCRKSGPRANLKY